MPPINVLLVASSYPTDSHDWRSRFISDMLNALSHDETLRLLFWGPPGDLPPGVPSVASVAEQRWLKSLMRRGGLAHLIRHRPLVGIFAAVHYLTLLHRACHRLRTAGIVHVNWLQNALALWRTQLPALVTVLGSDYGLLRHRAFVRLLRTVMRRRRCIIAPNAGWMAPRLQELFGDVAEIETVPFGVANAWYELKRMSAANRPQRWVVIARLTQKKLGPLFEWGEGLFDSERELHILGPRQEAIAIPTWAHYHGPTFPDEVRTKWFPSITGLITLSTHDEGRPQVVIEAMAAGVPVIASSIPAHGDVIRHAETGYLAGSRDSFIAALDSLADPDHAEAVGRNARAWVREHLGTWDDTARRYLSLYRRLLVKEAQ
jgi:hypothetical protein